MAGEDEDAACSYCIWDVSILRVLSATDTRASFVLEPAET